MHAKYLDPAGLVFAVAALAGFSGCSDRSAPMGPSLGLVVAPLDLPGIDFACYDFAVTGPSGPVVSLGNQFVSYLAGDTGAICSWQYGNSDGGDITYVAPCDTDDGDAESPAQATNTVTVWFDGLYVDADGDHVPEADVGDWQNPCPSGCSLQATCRENADTPVVFDFTVMRNARQGFFDVAVNFEDIFCSAKLDCRDQFLHNAAAHRAATAIVAFACTSGENAETHLYVSNLLLQCANGQTTIAATTTPGQAGPIGAGVFQSATYIGDEQLTSNGEPLEKCYWNRAIGLDLATLVGPCVLSGIATASATPLTPEMLIGEGTTYPIITWTVPVITANGALCEEHQLNADLSGVQTAYVNATTPNAAAIVNALLPPPLPAPLLGTGVVYACGAQSIACAAGPVTPIASADTVTATQVDDETITVTTGGQTATIALTGALAGFTLGSSCHQDDCCREATP